MNYFKWICGILFVLLIIIVAVQNHPAFSTTATFRLNLLFADWQTGPLSLYLVTVIAFLIGVFVSGIYGVVDRYRLKRQIRSLTEDVRARDQELKSLRNLPVTTEEMGSEPPAETS